MPGKENPGRSMAFTSREAWRAWLEANHATASEAWLLIGRKAASSKLLKLETAIEEALCFGWIQGALQPVDKETYNLRFSPRQPNSIWSVHNQARVEKLTREGRMTPAGMNAVMRAKQSGEWDAAMLREDVTSVPDDLVQVLEENDAWLAFDKWPASQKKMYLYWLETAKRPETREKRLHAILKKVKPWR